MSEDPYGVAADLAAQGREDLAYAKFAELLNRNFDDVRALYGLAKLYLEGEHYGLAFNLFRVCASFKRLGPGPWNQMGLCQAETYDVDTALYCFRRALQIDDKDVHALSIISLAHLLRCEPDKAIRFGNLALEVNPDFEAARHNIAYAHLLLRNWKEGWEGHQRILGKVKTRTERFYEHKGKILPRWDGSHGKSVLVYGEQGIGDEISFASCIPDLVGVSKFVALDCDHRLESLFRRSFPQVSVHGTRFKDPTEWIDEHELDACVAIGDLPTYFRNADTDFPGTPYLKAGPGRVAKWKQLFDGGVKPVIGIAWTGGKPNTGSYKRSLKLEDLEPILRAVPATWVSLEYKDRDDEIQAFKEKTGIEIQSYQASRSQDYDDTAGLVASVDLVVSVTTAVVHLSGALGKECWTLVPSNPRWFYGLEGDSVWYKSAKFFRQTKNGNWPVEDVAKLLKLRFG